MRRGAVQDLLITCVWHRKATVRWVEIGRVAHNSRIRPFLLLLYLNRLALAPASFHHTAILYAICVSVLAGS